MEEQYKIRIQERGSVELPSNLPITPGELGIAVERLSQSYIYMALSVKNDT